MKTLSIVYVKYSKRSSPLRLRDGTVKICRFTVSKAFCIWYGMHGMWCGVVWCGVVWCGVVWCGMNTLFNHADTYS